MPILTPSDYKEIRRAFFSDAETKAELKALANLPSETQLRDAMQAIEDDFTAMRGALRAKIATSFGIPTASLTPKLNRRMLAHYCAWKLRAILFTE